MTRWVVLASLLAGRAFAAEPVLHETQAWLASFSQVRVAESGFIVWLDVHLRLPQSAAQTNLIVRPGLGYRVHPEMTVWLGYAWVPTVRGEALVVDEHRLWQQWTWDHGFESGWRMQLRTRLEERLQAGALGLRLRQLVRAQTPRWGRFFVPLSDEAFVSLNDTPWGQEAGFDQNRLFIGLGAFITPQARLEVGYLNQWVHRRSAVDPMRHVASLNLFITL